MQVVLVQGGSCEIELFFVRDRSFRLQLVQGKSLFFLILMESRALLIVDGCLLPQDRAKEKRGRGLARRALELFRHGG